jgi:hypothetical protein
VRVQGKGRRRQFDGDDHLARLQHRLQLRRVARQTVKFTDWHHPLASARGNADARVQRRQGDVHVRRIDGDAGGAVAENRVHAVESFARAAARSGHALVAHVESDIGEITAAGALHQVAAHAGHIAQLRRCAREQRLAQ